LGAPPSWTCQPLRGPAAGSSQIPNLSTRQSDALAAQQPVGDPRTAVALAPAPAQQVPQGSAGAGARAAGAKRPPARGGAPSSPKAPRPKAKKLRKSLTMPGKAWGRKEPTHGAPGDGALGGEPAGSAAPGEGWRATTRLRAVPEHTGALVAGIAATLMCVALTLALVRPRATVARVVVSAPPGSRFRESMGDQWVWDKDGTQIYGKAAASSTLDAHGWWGYRDQCKELYKRAETDSERQRVEEWRRAIGVEFAGNTVRWDEAAADALWRSWNGTGAWTRERGVLMNCALHELPLRDYENECVRWESSVTSAANWGTALQLISQDGSLYRKLGAELVELFGLQARGDGLHAAQHVALTPATMATLTRILLNVLLAASHNSDFHTADLSEFALEVEATFDRELFSLDFGQQEGVRLSSVPEADKGTPKESRLVALLEEQFAAGGCTAQYFNLGLRGARLVVDSVSFVDDHTFDLASAVWLTPDGRRHPAPPESRELVEGAVLRAARWVPPAPPVLGPLVGLGAVWLVLQCWVRTATAAMARGCEAAIRSERKREEAQRKEDRKQLKRLGLAI